MQEFYIKIVMQEFHKGIKCLHPHVSRIFSINHIIKIFATLAVNVFLPRSEVDIPIIYIFQE